MLRTVFNACSITAQAFATISAFSRWFSTYLSAARTMIPSVMALNLWVLITSCGTVVEKWHFLSSFAGILCQLGCWGHLLSVLMNVKRFSIVVFVVRADKQSYTGFVLLFLSKESSPHAAWSSNKHTPSTTAVILFIVYLLLSAQKTCNAGTTLLGYCWIRKWII